MKSAKNEDARSGRSLVSGLQGSSAVGTEDVEKGGDSTDSVNERLKHVGFSSIRKKVTCSKPKLCDARARRQT